MKDKTEKNNIGNNMEKNKIGRLQRAILVSTVLPMLAMGVIIAIVASGNYRNVVETEVNRSLKAAAELTRSVYDSLYPGDYVLVGDKTVSLYKGEKELTGDFTGVDRIKADTGMEVTLFYRDARILTTITDENGTRSVATGVNGAIMSAMEKSMEPLFYVADINNESYHVCYVPLVNSDGSLAGMIGTGERTGEVEQAIKKQISPIVLVTILTILFASLISIRYTRGVVLSIREIRKFLGIVTEGRLDAEMGDRAAKRRDEIGEAAEGVVKMRDTLRVMVEKDPLTKLYNRRFGTARMKDVSEAAVKTGLPFAVAIGDIDFFKKVNDTYGHDAGDEVLRFVSLELRKLMVGKGFAVRWGGEEFLLIFDKLSEDQAAEALSGLMAAVRAKTIKYGERSIKVTMTFGIISGNTVDDMKDIVKKADEALYFGKTNGRNRMVRYEDLEGHEEEKSTAPSGDAGKKAEGGLTAVSEKENEDPGAEAESDAEALMGKLADNV